MASECQAYYNESANQSIFHIGNDLNMSLLFADESHARGFLSRLDLVSADHARFHNMITFDTSSPSSSSNIFQELSVLG